MESPREGSGVLALGRTADRPSGFATGNPMIEMTTPVQPDADDDDEANDDDAVAASLRLLDSAGEAPEVPRGGHDVGRGTRTEASRRRSFSVGPCVAGLGDLGLQ